MSKFSAQRELQDAVGMPVALRDWLKDFNEAKRELERHGYKRTPTVVREAFERVTRRFLTESPEISQVLDDLVPGSDYDVPVRLYHPEPTSPLPIAVFAHGGGHLAGNVSLYDPIARKLAAATRHIIVSVDYRLAPECPYPAALRDLLAVIKRVGPVLAERGCLFTPTLSLIGDSAGGALCATAAHLLQFEPTVTLHRQTLIYPSLDYTLSFPSVTEYAEGYLLEFDRAIWYFDQYLQNAESRKSLSPVFMECTSNLPDTLVFTAEHCLLRDEGIAYVEHLLTAGVRAEHVLCDGMIHAFLNLENLVPEQCAGVYREIGGFLNA
jgi:acetyl esterase/lipase